MNHSIVLFGEAQKGSFEAAYVCHNLLELSHYLGEPPNKEARGLYFAIQMVLNNYGIIFFRVHEEGFSQEDYLKGFAFLENKELFPHFSALCLPGVGSQEILSATSNLCQMHKSYLIVTEKDLYDYLTDSSYLR